MAANRPFDLAERKQIQKLIKQNLSLTQIAEQIGRSKNGVITEVRSNGGRENYNAAEADGLALDRQLARWEKLTSMNKKQAKGFQFRPRVENIEAQLEILFSELEKVNTILKAL